MLDYTMFVRDENNNLILDRNGKYRDTTKVFKTSTRKTWDIEERECLLNSVLNSKTGSFDEVSTLFENSGYTDLRPVHVNLVKRYISYGVTDKYLNGKSFLPSKT